MSFFSDTINWTNIEQHISSFKEKKNEYQGIYINGPHGIGKTHRILELCTKYKFSIYHIHSNFFVDGDNVEEYFEQLIFSKSVLSFFDEESLDKVFIFDELECKESFKKLNAGYQYMMGMLDNNKFFKKTRYLVIFIGYLQVITLTVGQQKNILVYQVNPPTVEEADLYIKQFFKENQKKISDQGSQIIANFCFKDISQLMFHLKSLLKICEKEKTVRLPLINNHFRYSLVKNPELHMFEFIIDLFNSIKIDYNIEYIVGMENNNINILLLMIQRMLYQY